jgi:hypothetical protein
MHHRSVPSWYNSISTSESDLDSLIFLLLTILPIVSSLPVLLFLRNAVAYLWGASPLQGPYCRIKRFSSQYLLFPLQKTSVNLSSSLGNLSLTSCKLCRIRPPALVFLEYVVEYLMRGIPVLVTLVTGFLILLVWLIIRPLVVLGISWFFRRRIFDYSNRWTNIFPSSSVPVLDFSWTVFPNWNVSFFPIDPRVFTL